MPSGIGKAILALSAIFVLSPALAQSEPKAPPSAAPPAGIVTWIRRNSVSLGSSASSPTPQEARLVSKIVQGADVVAIGEIGHEKREPLQYRNRLIRHLVTHERLAAVALESGLAESKILYDYVLGGEGDAASKVRAGLTHGFGLIKENVELVEWLRQHNRAHPTRPVRFYGIDFSSTQSTPSAGTGSGGILQQLNDYLLRTIAAESAEVRAALLPFTSRFNEAEYRNWSTEERAEFARASKQLGALFLRHKAGMVRASSPDEQDWAARMAYDAQQLPALFATWMIAPSRLDDPVQLEQLRRLIQRRDAAMAAHTRWVLERERARGKVLLFQTNGHIAADVMFGSIMRWFKTQPTVTGTLLRQALGSRYRAIATVSSFGRASSDNSLGSVDRAFAAAGRSPILLDLHAPGRPTWWAQPQSASQGEARVDDFVPARAFDAMIYLDRLTPVPAQPRY